MGDNVLADRLEQILSAVTDGYYVLDVGWRFVHVSSPAAQHFGRPVCELVGRNIWQETGVGPGTDLYDAFHQAASGTGPVRVEAESRIRPGDWYELNLLPHGGGLAVFFRSISNRKRAEAALADSEELTERKRAEEAREANRRHLETVVQHVPAAVNLIRGRDLRLQLVNAAYQAIAPDKEMVGKTLAELWPETEKDFTALCRRVLETGEPYHVDDDLNMIRRSPDGPLEPAYFSWSLHRVELPGDDGWGILNTAWETTSRRLTEQALRESEAKLRELNAQLAEADRRKDEFIAVLSHELRNPLAPIKYALPLLQREALGEAGRRAVAVIERQVHQLTRHVDDLLDISRITSNKIELRREHVTLASVLTAAMEAASPAIAGALHTLRTSVPDDPIWVDVDPTRAAQIITNLLDNSAKFTPRGGQIELEAVCEDSHAVVRVRDNGVGIPEAQLKSIFEMFHQVRQPGSGTGGLGIGLGLVRQLVQMHGGTIEVRSAGIGRGSEFIVRFPLAPESREAVEAPIETDEASNRRLRILVVDDNLDFVDMLATLVSTLGHDVRKAFDGRSALSAARTYRPDVVLLDLGLPVLDGLEVARRLRADRELRATRLVALTGWGQAEDRRRTEEAGFDFHLTKPTNPGTLQRLLADIAAAGLPSR